MHLIGGRQDCPSQNEVDRSREQPMPEEEVIIGVGNDQSSGGLVTAYRWCTCGHTGSDSSIFSIVGALLVPTGSTSCNLLGF